MLSRHHVSPSSFGGERRAHQARLLVPPSAVPAARGLPPPAAAAAAAAAARRGGPVVPVPRSVARRRQQTEEQEEEEEESVAPQRRQQAAAALPTKAPLRSKRRAAAAAAPQPTPSPAPAAAEGAAAARQLRRQPSSSSGSGSGSTASASSSSSLVEWRDGTWRLWHYDAAAVAAAAAQLAARLRAGVAAERAAEREAVARLYAGGAAALARLKRDGVVLADLLPSPVGTLYGQQKWAVAPAPAQPPSLLPPHHRFRAGDAVLLSPMVPHIPSSSSSTVSAGPAFAAPLDATVLEVSRDRLVLALDNAAGDALAARLAAPVAAAAAASKPTLRWRLDRSPSDAAAQRQLDAVARLESGRWALPADRGSPSGGDAFEALVRAALVGAAEAVAAAAGARSWHSSPLERVASTPPPWVRDAAWRARAVALLGAQDALNDSQRAAVATALTRTLTLWQGPPGTGKTRTCLTLIDVLVRASEDNGGIGGKKAPTPPLPVLAVGDTNAAADNLLEGLAARGLRVVRVGGAARVRPSLRHLSLEAQAEATPLGRQAAEMRARSRALFAQARHLASQPQQQQRRQRQQRGSARTRGGDEEDDDDDQDDDDEEGGGSLGSSDWRARAALLEAEARREWGRAERLARAAARSVLEHAQVVAATCSAAGDASVLGGSSSKTGAWKATSSSPPPVLFRAVIVDEATQATEPATLVPLLRGAQMVVLAGDPRQLPPTVVSREALLPPALLSRTLFDRLSEEEEEEEGEEQQGDSGGAAVPTSSPSPARLAPRLLNVQYRMHPALARFPSRRFYGGRLKDGVRAAERLPPRGVAWPNPRVPAVVVRVEGGGGGGGGERRDDDDDGRGGGSDSDSDSEIQLGPPKSKRASGGSGGGGSYRNESEAREALRALYALLRGGDVRSVAILSPYRGQVRLIERLLRAPGPSAWLQRVQRRLEEQQQQQEAGEESAASAAAAARSNGLGGAFSAALLVTVSSVDGFQGREADAVVLSVVRSNARGRLGFVSDPRRLCVAASRARRGFVVLCSARTLRASGSRDWGAFLDWAEQQGVVVVGGGGDEEDSARPPPWPAGEPRWGGN